MQTFREAVSDVMNDLNSVNHDDVYSYRFIINKLRDKAKLFLKQDADMRKIFKMNDLWKPLNCIELEDYDLLECPWFLKDCTKIKRSKQLIPDSYETSYGNAIVIAGLKNNMTLKQIKPFQYEEYSSNKFAKGKVFWISDGRLFIPDSTLEYVKGFEPQGLKQK